MTVCDIATVASDRASWQQRVRPKQQL
jgi:hypothetical protein